VRDHGPGFGGTDPGQLFERFSQGQPGPYGRSAGFGLGLFVVRSYLEQFGGTVTAADHPDGGAQFTCRVREWEPSLKGVA
jgi:signal transduction histidine kinase